MNDDNEIVKEFIIAIIASLIIIGVVVVTRYVLIETGHADWYEKLERLMKHA